MFGLHYNLERSAIGMVLGIVIVASIGGFIEIAPLFTIDETVEVDPNMRVYTPLDVHPRGLLRLSLPDDPHTAR
jgi:cytochrome c oxidase cbb3-type subunit 2